MDIIRCEIDYKICLTSNGTIGGTRRRKLEEEKLSNKKKQKSLKETLPHSDQEKIRRNSRTGPGTRETSMDPCISEALNLFLFSLFALPFLFLLSRANSKVLLLMEVKSLEQSPDFFYTLGSHVMSPLLGL